MAVTDPEAIRFINEEVRPLCEMARAFKARVDSMMTSWYAGLNVVVPNDAGQAIDDGRDAEGVSRLNGDDVHSAVGILEAMVATPTPYNEQIIELPTVRPLNVTLE